MHTEHGERPAEVQDIDISDTNVCDVLLVCVLPLAPLNNTALAFRAHVSPSLREKGLSCGLSVVAPRMLKLHKQGAQTSLHTQTNHSIDKLTNE